MNKLPRAIEWVGGSDGCVRLIDQTQLPEALVYRDCHTVEEVWEAIRSLRVRGAPAIGIAGAMGVVLGVKTAEGSDRATIARQLEGVISYLAMSRPTAVNLFWALERMRNCFARSGDGGEPARESLLREALAIQAEDERMCRAIGEAGASMITDDCGVLTHCNAGALATGGIGTALAVLYVAAEQGRTFRVFADETRPLLQGARLTTWELRQAGLDVTLLCDNMAAQVMKEGRVQLVLVGADRIAANGDTANKIGTYGLAVLARVHDIPFYVAAPSSTFDLALPTGEGIPIEQRDPNEVTHGCGKQTAPEGVAVYNPAFDVTSHLLISGIITEKGVIQPVSEPAIRSVLGEAPSHN
jgi:methylthioribose-1-phosphate isomerase